MRHANAFLVCIGFLANVTALAGLVTSHARDIVVAAAVLAALCGLYFFLKRWGKPVDWYALLAVAVIVMGSVMLTFALRTPSTGNGTTTETGDNTSTETTPKTGGPSDGKPVVQNKNHTVVFEKSFKLNAQDGLELDDEKGTISVQQSTAKAPIDLHLSGWPLLSVSVKKFYAYQPLAQPTGNADKDEYASCRNLIDTSQLGITSISSTAVTPGLQYCITTTRGRVALITLQEMIDAGYNATKNTVSFTVKLWN